MMPLLSIEGVRVHVRQHGGLFPRVCVLRAVQDGSRRTDGFRPKP